MTIKSLIFLGGCCAEILFSAGLALAQPDRIINGAVPLTLSLASEHVDISTEFAGAPVVVFGTVQKQSASQHLAMTLKGPEVRMIVRKKERSILGVWSNGRNIEFRRVPSYYDYALETGIGSADVAGKTAESLELNPDHLGFYSEQDDMDDKSLDVFRDALIRQLQTKGFYAIKPVAITYVTPTLFRVDFSLPAGVPTGLYTVDAAVYDAEGVVSRQSQILRVGQVGFNARVYIFAHEHGFFYGVFTVMLALIFGWSAFTFLRRD